MTYLHSQATHSYALSGLLIFLISDPRNSRLILGLIAARIDKITHMIQAGMPTSFFIYV